MHLPRWSVACGQVGLPTPASGDRACHLERSEVDNMARTGAIIKKGSQLSQLKQSIRNSGLSRVSVPSHNTNGQDSKKRKRSSIGSQIKDPEFRQTKLAEIQADQNLFDLKTSKIKFPTAQQLAGQKTSRTLRLGPNAPEVSTVGKPTQSATRAHQKRVESLLPEYQNRHKSSQFLDNRFGEGDSTLTPEEKALERFTKERQSRLPSGKKPSIFNLDDEGEGLHDDGQLGSRMTLTHHGFGLDLGDPDNGDGHRLGPNHSLLSLKPNSGDAGVNHLSIDHNEDSRPKSKAEVMSEIIVKSKAHKYQRQVVREKDDELRCNLNDELAEIRSLLLSSQPTAPPRVDKTTSVVGNVSLAPSFPDNPTHSGVTPREESACNLPSHDETTTKADQQEQQTESRTILDDSSVDRKLLASLIGLPDQASSSEPGDSDDDDYDRFVRQLAFEARAKPSDRLKTVEEAAAEEAKRLEELEQKRLRRMRGLEDDDENEATTASNSLKSRKRRKPQADDLDDDYADNDQPAPWELGQGLRHDGAFGAGEENEEDSHADSAEGSVQWDEESCEDEDAQSSCHSISLSEGTKFLSKKNRVISTTVAGVPADSHELAYTYPCPASHAEFLSILSVKSVKSIDVPTVVQRIRILYHPSLHQDNKDRLAQFTKVLVDHIIHITSTPTSHGSSCFQLVVKLLPHIIDLSRQFTQTAATHFMSKLNVMEKNLTRALGRETHLGWPGLSELILLRLIGLLWSTSDFSHPVVAPSLILMCQCLDQLAVKNFQNLLSGLFMCSLILQYETHSARLVPEVMNFLTATLLRLTTPKIKPNHVTGMVPLPEGQDFIRFPVNDSTSSGLRPQPMNFWRIDRPTPLDSIRFPTDQDIVNALDACLSLLRNFSQLYSASSFYSEVFEPLEITLGNIDTAQSGVCEESKRRLDELRQSIENTLSQRQRIRSLNPLKLQSHRPIPLKSQAPQFESSFTPSQKKFNPDTAQVEANKLKALIKKEKKGAIRELRKDNRFLAVEKAREKDKADTEYKTKIARITAGLQLERSEEKKQERTKVRLKRLDKARGFKK